MQLIIFFLIVQTTAILGAVLFGILADSYGQKKTIILSLFIWIFTILLAFFSSGKNSFLVIYTTSKLNMDPDLVVRSFFYLVGLSAGSVMGGTQSVSRSLMSKLTPPDRKTEFFGFYSFFGKSSAIVGPFVFGIVSYVTGQQRLAILTIGIFFIVGLAILKYVNDPRPIELIKEGS
jgi:UMF1 family MFS transporter